MAARVLEAITARSDAISQIHHRKYLLGVNNRVFSSGEVKKIIKILTWTSFLLQFRDTFVFLRQMAHSRLCMRQMARMFAQAENKINFIWRPIRRKEKLRDSPRPLNFSAHLRNYLLYTINFVSPRHVIFALPLIDYVHSHCDLWSSEISRRISRMQRFHRGADMCRREALRL